MWNKSLCTFCGECLEKCLYVDYDRERGEAEIRALASGDAAPILDACVLCCGCREYCPTGADPFDLICRMEEKTGIFPAGPGEIAWFEDMMELPSEVIPGDPDRPILSLCFTEPWLPAGAIDGDLFKGMGIAKGGKYFCIFGYVHTGRVGPLEQNARRFIDNVADLGRDIVFLHDECYTMTHAKVGEYGITVPFNYKHIFEYLRDYLRDNRSRVTRLERPIAYQRPCSSRFTPEKEIFLDEIFDLIGVDRIEREYDREQSLCCTGPLLDIYPERAAEIQKRNIDDAVAGGATALINLCPGCDRALKNPAAEAGLQPIYITNLCRMALGELASDGSEC